MPAKEKTIGIKEFQAKFPGILDKLPVVITKRGKPVAKIQPVEPTLDTDLRKK